VSSRACEEVRGYPAKYGSYGAYYKHITQHPQQHAPFLEAVKEWVRAHNKDPTKARVSPRKVLEEVRTTLDVVHASGTRFERPKKQFVVLEQWDEEAYGTIDPSQIVTEQVFGQMVKGIWRQLGKAGHYDYISYEDSCARTATREHTGEGPFAEQALEAKREAIVSAQRDAERARAAIAVQATTPLEAKQVLAMVTGLISKVGVGGSEAAVKAQAGAVSDREEEEAEAVSDREVGDARSRLRMHFGPRGGSASAAPKVTAPKRAVAKPAKAAAKTSLDQPEPPRSGTEGSKGQELPAVDGRNQRLTKALQDGIEDVAADLEAIAFDIRHRPPPR
jgi:hypothetical protein